MAGSPKTDDKTAATGQSEEAAARPVPFETNKNAGPSGDGDRGDEPPDAAEAAGTKRPWGEKAKPEADPGAVSPDDLTTETDDGVS